MKSGGEILRGVLEASCVWSAPAFYCIPLNADSGTADARATFRGSLQLDKDRFFLACGIVPAATQSPGFERINNNENIRLYDPVNGASVALTPEIMKWSLIGDSSLNCPFTLPEYLLWDPGTLIGVEWEGINYQAGAEIGFKFLTLTGIEYSMPSKYS